MVVVKLYYAGTGCIAIFLNMESHYKHFNAICNYNHFRILPEHEHILATVLPVDQGCNRHLKVLVEHIFK